MSRNKQDLRHIFQSIILGSIAGIFLLIMTKLNPSLDPDRHYYETNRFVYYTMKLCYLILVFACILNVKFVVIKGFMLAMGKRSVT